MPLGSPEREAGEGVHTWAGLVGKGISGEGGQARPSLARGPRDATRTKPLLPGTRNLSLGLRGRPRHAAGVRGDWVPVGITPHHLPLSRMRSGGASPRGESCTVMTAHSIGGSGPQTTASTARTHTVRTPREGHVLKSWVVAEAAGAPWRKGWPGCTTYFTGRLSWQTQQVAPSSVIVTTPRLERASRDAGGGPSPQES